MTQDTSTSCNIAVVAPGGFVQPDKLEPGLRWLADLPADVLLGHHVYRRERHFSGTTVQRLKDLQWALTAPEIDLVWFARGGSGTAQLLDHLSWDQIPHDRLVIGFSDATSLLLSLAEHGIESLHGPVLTSFAGGPETLSEESVRALGDLLISGCSTPLPGVPLCGPTTEVRGRVLGGNLTVLASLAGTRHSLHPAGSLLVLEDVGEAPYRLERSLVQLIQSGAFVGVKGVALGEFLNCHPGPDAAFKLEDLFIEHLEPLGIPVLHQLPVGHGKRNIAFRYGAEGTLTSTGLIIENPAQGLIDPVRK